MQPPDEVSVPDRLPGLWLSSGSRHGETTARPSPGPCPDQGVLFLDSAASTAAARLEPAGPGDVAAVTRQLGRVPRGLLAVVRRSRCGFPQVVLTAPLFVRKGSSGAAERDERVSVFPTQFWLTCPLLYEAISLLEAEGWIQRLEERLRGDPAFQRAMEESHRGAAAFRVSLVPPQWRARLQDPRYRGQWSVLARSGVAGIREAAAGRAGGIKCLHAHYADWVGRGQNPVGAWVARTLQERGVPEECDDDCVQRCGPQG